MNTKQKKSFSFRKVCHWAHLWLGLISGIIVFIIAITGCIYTFQEELRSVFQPQQSVIMEDKPFLSPHQLKEKAEPYVFKLPGDSLNAIYGVSYSKRDKPVTVAYNHSEKGYTLLLLNPYSGEYIGEQTYSGDFFGFILSGHRNLWLPYAIGHQIVGWAVVVFAIVTITGIVLWIPRKWKKKAIKAGLVIKRKSRSFMLFYELHKVLGFYTVLFALIFALTGLTWSFKWYSNTYYKVISGGEELKEWTPAFSDTTLVSSFSNPDDVLWERVKQEYKIGEQGVFIFDFPIGETGAYRICFNSADNNETYYKRHFRFFDRNSLQELEGGGIYGISYEKSSNADKFYRMTYDIHVGAIGGLPGKIIMFLASFIIASLPVTGFIIWLKKKKPKVEK